MYTLRVVKSHGSDTIKPAAQLNSIEVNVYTILNEFVDKNSRQVQKFKFL